MKIVKLKGGLGNQMFQYAFAKNIEKKTGEQVKLDLSAYDSLNDDIRKPRILKFNLSLPIASKEDNYSICKLQHKGNSLGNMYKAKLFAEILINRRYYFEWDRAPRNIDGLLKYDYFDGYWQCWEYIKEVFEDLRRDFTPKNELHTSTKELMEVMQNQNSVFVGIRRGDYTLHTKRFGSFDQNYYERAMQYIEERVSSPVYYIFSNDIEWVKQNMNFGSRSIVYREQKDIIDDFEDLILMMNCKHSIVVNSTYHWWGGRMNFDEGKIVVAPRQWFFDGSKIEIIPPEWIRLES